MTERGWPETPAEIEAASEESECRGWRKELQVTLAARDHGRLYALVQEGYERWGPAVLGGLIALFYERLFPRGRN